MGISLVNDVTIDLPHVVKYRKAILSVYHMAFVDNDNRYVFPLDEKESIKASVEFYKKIISQKENYPVFNGKTFVRKDVSDKEVIRQAFGIPSCVFETLDLNAPIVEQLHFDRELNEERKSVYQLYYGSQNKNWYRDDFKNYCLRSGVFFLYDETKPFISGSQKDLPVYFLESRFEQNVFQLLYSQAKSKRFAIDFLGLNATPKMIREMEKLDKFSFDMQIDYFINGQYYADIADLGLMDEFKTKYSLILRQYVASLINVLYDQYSFSYLNKVTQKMSFMSQSVTRAKNRYYVLSSFQAEMYSLDRETWFFSEKDKERIYSLIKDTYEKRESSDILCFYSHLELPYVGYKYVKDLKNFTPEEVFSRLPFKKTQDQTLRYLSAKRFDLFYSYLTGEKEHRYVFLKRILREQGFIYQVSNPFEQKYTLPISLYIQEKERIPELDNLLKEGTTLSETIYLSYHLDENPIEAAKLRPILKQIDKLSNQTACRDFFYSTLGTNIEMATETVLSKYHAEKYLSAEIYHFFRYLFFYPFKIALAQYRSSLLEKKEGKALILLDKTKDKTETYEPNLPYPFVTWGSLCYSFRESYFSNPYVCSSEKQAIASCISYYSRRFDQINAMNRKSNQYFITRNAFVLSKIGLPNNIKSLLVIDQDLLSQIPFKDHICHRCLDAEPAYSEKEMDNLELPGWTYVTSDGAKKGFYAIEQFQGGKNYETRLYDSIISHKYHALIEYDAALLSPILLPYLKSDKKSITALLTTTFPGDCITDATYHPLSSFLDLGEDKIHHLLFDCREEDYPDLVKNLKIFNLLAMIYRFISLIYPVKVSEGYKNSTDIPVSLNDDDNNRLVYPHVLLGRVFNAYQEKQGADEIWFCSCDKEPIRDFLKVFYDIAEENHVRKDIENPFVLAMAGLPYEAILSLQEYDFSLGNVDDFVDHHIHFRDYICRRCSNINHSALITPFYKGLPNKDGKEAEWAFARNALAHAGVMFLNSSYSLNFKYDPNYRFNLESDFDDKLPLVYVRPSNPDVSIYQFFVMGYESLKNQLYKFCKTQQDKTEAAAYASGVILDTYQENEEVLYQFFFDNYGQDNYRKSILSRFSQIKRVRKEMLDETMQMILLFMNYLLNQLMEKIVNEEGRVGR